jgi:hypothetical protein
MPENTDKITNDIDVNETEFYAKLVPSLLNQIAETRKKLKQSIIAHEKTKQDMRKLYTDYNKELCTSYNLTQSVQTWKAVSLLLLGLLVTFIILGAI